MKARLDSTLGLIYNIGRLHVPDQLRADIIRTKALPRALYGIEGSQPPGQQMRKVASAIKDAITHSSTHRSHDLTFAVCSNGSDLDPEVHMLIRRVILLRRMMTKHVRASEAVLHIYRLYKSHEYDGTDVGKVLAGRVQPAPPIGTSGRTD